MRKIYGREQLQEELERNCRPGRRIVFTNGCFDILHAGHVRYLRKARAMGDVLVVAVNSDASVRALKGEKRPVVPEAERAELVAALEMVDYVTIFSELTPLALIEQLRPDVLVKGGDWPREAIVGREAVESWGGRVAIVPLEEGLSTTNIVDKVLSVYRGGNAASEGDGLSRRIPST